MLIELKAHENARLRGIAEELGLNPNEAARTLLIQAINWRHRELQIEKFKVAYFEWLVEGE